MSQPAEPPAPAPVNTVHDQTFTAPVQVVGVTTAPMVGLFQPPFQLGQPDFMRLRSSNAWQTPVGTALVAYALPNLVQLAAQAIIAKNAKAPQADLTVSWWFHGGVGAIGLVLLVVGLFYSRERRDVMKRIKAHFRDNPERTIWVKP